MTWSAIRVNKKGKPVQLSGASRRIHGADIRENGVSYLSKFLAALVSTPILTALISLLRYTPKDEMEPGVYHFAFTELFILYSFYVAPIYFIFGIGVSWTVSQYVDSHVKKLKVYLLSGAGISVLLAILTMYDTVIIPAFPLSMLFGAVAAFIFWVIEQAFDKLMEHLRTSDAGIKRIS